MVERQRVRFRAGGPRFKSQAGPIEHSGANGSPPLQTSWKEPVLLGHNDAEMGLQTRHTLRRSTASILKNLILVISQLNFTRTSFFGVLRCVCICLKRRVWAELTINCFEKKLSITVTQTWISAKSRCNFRQF